MKTIKEGDVLGIKRKAPIVSYRRVMAVQRMTPTTYRVVLNNGKEGFILIDNDSQTLCYGKQRISLWKIVSINKKPVNQTA